MTTETPNETSLSFEDLFKEASRTIDTFEKRVIQGRVIAVERDFILIDVGLKSEGAVPIREFKSGEVPQVGDIISVYVERFEDRDGKIVLSYERARREASWKTLEDAHDAKEPVTGVIFGRVKGGFTVDLSGVVAFLPGSQMDVRPIKDVDSLIGVEQPFLILKIDRSRNNLVVSRRAIMEESQSEVRADLISRLDEGQVLKGVVKNITDYGAFVDLGGIDGLLHVTDISWRRVSHPSDVLSVGDQIDVQVIRFNRETERISLGLKQLSGDPWKDVAQKYPVGSRIKGVVTNVTEYGAFVELEPGVEGLIHVSEFSWSKKTVPPSRILSTSQEVEAVVLEVDEGRRRLSLGLKQLIPNPWERIRDEYPEGHIFEGTVKDVTDFGLFVGLVDDIDAIVHLADLSWEKPGEESIKDYKRGDKVNVKVLRVDLEKSQVVLGIKQAIENPVQQHLSKFKKGNVVTCEVSAVFDHGLEVTFADGQLNGYIKRSELSRDRGEQSSSRFAVGEKVDAKIILLDAKDGGNRIQLSIKAREIEEEKRVMAEYGSSDSGATLGDILGVAIAKKKAQVNAQAQKEKEQDSVAEDKDD
jgi:small subunit ribosomal protein S1